MKNCPEQIRKGKLLEEAKENLQEVIAMTFEANRVLAEESIAEMHDVIREPVFVQTVKLSEISFAIC